MVLLIVSVLQAHGQELAWQPTESPQGTVLFLSSQKKYLYTGIHGQGVYRTNNLGDSWERSDKGIASLTPRCMAAHDKYFFIGTGNGIYRSAQDDLNWERKDAGLSTVMILSLAQKGKILFAGTDQGIFISNDAGETWEKANLPKPIGVSRNIYSMLVKDGNIIAGTSRSAYLSADDGKTWLLMDVGTPHDIVTLATNGKIVYLGTSGDQIIETERLSSWEKSTKQTPGLSNVQAMVIVDSTIYTGGNIKGVVKDTQKIDKELPFEGIRSIAVHDKILFGGTLKFGVWKYALKPKKLNAYGLDGINKNGLNNYGLKVFPNPAQKSSNRRITYWLSSSEKIELQIFNSIGVLVHRADLGIVAEGQYELNLNETSNYQAGIYICVLRIGNKLLIEKLIFSED